LLLARLVETAIGVTVGVAAAVLTKPVDLRDGAT